LKELHQIPISALDVDSWYVGRGRNGNVGLWDGNVFSVIADCLVYNGNFRTPQKTKAGVKNEPYFTEDEGCFQPFKKIDDAICLAEGSGIKHIPISKLEVGCFYLGRGSISNVARWEGNCFSVISDFCTSPEVCHSEIKSEKHKEEGGGFQPLRVIGEGKVLKPFIEDGRKHLVYATTMQI